MGKVHGSLARAGKVRGQTPKVEKQEKKKTVRGRANKRMLYNRRFVNAVVNPAGGKPRMNTIAIQQAKKAAAPPAAAAH